MNLVLLQIPLDEVHLFLFLLLVLNAVESCDVIAILNQHVSVSFEEVAAFMCPAIEKVHCYLFRILLTANHDHLFEDVPPKCHYLRRVLASLDGSKFFAVSHVASQEEAGLDFLADVLIVEKLH